MVSLLRRTAFSLLRVTLRQRGLRRSQPRNWHSERRAAHIIKVDLMTEVDRLGIAAVLATDTDLEFRLHAATAFRAEPNQLADTLPVKHLKRIVAHDLPFNVVRQEAA